MDIRFLFCLLIPLINADPIESQPASSAVLDVNNINIVLPESLSEIYEFPDYLVSSYKDENERDFRISKLVAALKAKTQESQKPVMELLRSFGVAETQITQMWIANEIFVKNVTQSLLASLMKALPEKYIIQAPPMVHSIHFESNDEVDLGKISPKQSAQWGVEKIGAPTAWQVTRGEGIIVGSIGTGVHIGHEALSDGFAGAWSDPVDNTSTPIDPNGYDTHVLGTAIGRTNGIGVAPEAQWIACRALNAAGSGTMANIIACAQFMLEADPKPHVIVNGWGGSSTPALDSVLRAWKTAGIFATFPVGAGGPGCGSVAAPSSSPDVLGLAYTNSNDEVGSGTGRGPAEGGLVKPDFAAPGSTTLSAWNSGPDSYLVLTSSGSGSAHAAGAIALIKSYNNSLSYDEVIELLRLNSVKPPLSDTDRSCSDSEWPNMSYGYGRIDVTFLGQ